MKQKYFILGAAVAAALASTSGMATSVDAALAGINTSETPRITQTVNNGDLFTLPRSHLGFVVKASVNSVPVEDAAPMQHLQLILKPSAMRAASLETLIANQHNPKSAQFQKWLTPQQYGETFGVVDSDIAAVKAWLTSQGFTVNNVYPNKTQIDFTGTAAQVRQAFHTQENVYTINNEKHLANAGDISVPTALKSVVVGVMGLNDFHAKPLVKQARVAQMDRSKNGFVLKDKAAGNSKVIGQAIEVNQGFTRGLAPNDMMTMYGFRTLRSNGVTGKGVTIAVVEEADMVTTDWSNFVSTFNLGQYGGTYSQVNPAPPSGASNCIDPNVSNAFDPDDTETLLDAEWATAIAPSANIVVATCGSDDANGNPETSNFFGGVFIAATNEINAATPPNIISASYGYGEYFVDPASKTAIDMMWAQADAEGISVFVAAGDSGTNPSFNGSVINGYDGNTAIDANAFGTSPNVTVVGGTDLADVLDGTTRQYFAPTPSVVGGSALSYVPEIPWNASCGNGVAAKAMGFTSAVTFCQEYTLPYLNLNGQYLTSEGTSGGPSLVDAKPAWQRQVFGAARDQSRDLPDVSLFGGSYGNTTLAIICTSNYPCSPSFTGGVALISGTSLSSPMFAGIQALMDQGLAARGLPLDQGNAAPTLYALAANEYGSASGTPPASLAACSADNGTKGTAGCVFHNVTRGSISTNCYSQDVTPMFSTANCYAYGMDSYGPIGLTTTDASPTSYGVGNKAYGAQPGWSFANGLGSVNATNLLVAWRAFVNAPPAASQ